jgi:hypothetical protein
MLLTAAMGACALPAQADFAMTYARDGACEMEPAAFYVRGAMLRIDSAGGSALYDGVEQFITYLDHASHTQFQLELDDDALDLQADIGTATGHRLDKHMARAQEMMDANRGQMQAACRQMQSQGMACPELPNMNIDSMMARQQQMMANMDPKMLEQAGLDAEAIAEQQQMMAQWQAQQQRAQATIVDTGRSEHIAGIDCTVREWRLGEEVLEQRCDAPWQALQLDAREQQALQRAVKRMQRWGSTMDPLMARFDAPRNDDGAAGPTLRKTCYQAGQVVGSVSARIAREPLSAELFEIPAGYKAGM